MLVVSGSQISGIPCGGVQGTARVLYNKDRESAQEDAVTDGDSLQAAKDNLYHYDKGNKI